MNEIAGLGVVLALLVYAARVLLRQAREREAMEAARKRDQARVGAMLEATARALAGEHECEVCRRDAKAAGFDRVTIARLHDGAAILCPSCAAAMQGVV